jgi:hypothetical protein
MIYKKLNSNIQDKIDNKIKKKHKNLFKEALLFDLLKYQVKLNINFIKSKLIN